MYTSFRLRCSAHASARYSTALADSMNASWDRCQHGDYCYYCSFPSNGSAPFLCCIQDGDARLLPPLLCQMKDSGTTAWLRLYMVGQM